MTKKTKKTYENVILIVSQLIVFSLVCWNFYDMGYKRGEHKQWNQCWERCKNDSTVSVNVCINICD